MKRIMKIVLAAVFSITAHCASAKDLVEGSWMVSGDMDISFLKSETELGSSSSDIDTTTIDTELVYYLSHNIGLGAVVFYQDNEYSDTVGSASDTFTTWGPVITANFSQGFDSGFRLSLALVTGDIESSTATSSTSDDVEGFLAAIEYNNYLSDSVSLDIGYTYGQLEVDLGSFDEELTTSGITVGFTVYFGGRR